MCQNRLFVNPHSPRDVALQTPMVRPVPGMDDGPAWEGSNFLHLASNCRFNRGGVEQVVAGLIIGQAYILSFAAGSYYDGYTVFPNIGTVSIFGYDSTAQASHTHEPRYDVFLMNQDTMIYFMYILTRAAMRL